MKILYFDCYCGISGDMTLAALSSLGVSPEYICQQLSTLHIDEEFTLHFHPAEKQGISAQKADVCLHGHTRRRPSSEPAESQNYGHTHAVSKEYPEGHSHDENHNSRQGHWHGVEHGHHHGRCLLEINALIDGSGITPNAKALAKKIFGLIARAEGKIHGKAPQEIHFHEVGATDSIVDIVGCAICIDALQPDRIYSSPLCDGRGFINCAHGRMPVPAPATLEILKDAGVPLQITDEEGEMVTPTGAGIIAALAEGFSFPQNAVVQKTGYGAGTKNFKRANILRCMLCETEAFQDTFTMLETNIDDSTPEQLGFATELLLEAGALDVFSTPIYMKKNRPACCLSVLTCGDTTPFEAILFTHTTTIGLRKYQVSRSMLNRRVLSVETPYGTIPVKAAEFQGKWKYKPEFEAVRQASLKYGRTYAEITAETFRLLDKNYDASSAPAHTED